MFLISSIINGQDLETAITQAKTAYKNRQLAYQRYKKSALKDCVPEEEQQNSQNSMADAAGETG